MDHYYTPSSAEGNGTKAMNAKGRVVDALFSANRTYKIDWKYGPNRGIITDDNGCQVLVINPGNGQIYTDSTGESSAQPVLFTPALFKKGDKTAIKMNSGEDDLFMLLKSQLKQVDGYSVAKLDVANLSACNQGTPEATHFVIFQHGQLIDVLRNQKTDRKLRLRLEELGADTSAFPNNIFRKQRNTIGLSGLTLLKHRFSMVKEPKHPIKVLDNKKLISESASWMEALAAIYQCTESKESFIKWITPLLSKSFNGLILKTLSLNLNNEVH